MIVRETIKRKLGDAPYRQYMVSYASDTSERAEAVSFFGAFEHALFAADPFPRVIDAMSFEDAQAYLDEHPSPRRWEILTITTPSQFTDADLRRLRYIPELKIIKILSDCLTDAGVRHLRALDSVEVLCLFSRRLTDACLADIATMRTLKHLDLQGSPGITLSAFQAATTRLPLLVDIYPPREGVV